MKNSIVLFSLLILTGACSNSQQNDSATAAEVLPDSNTIKKDEPTYDTVLVSVLDTVIRVHNVLNIDQSASAALQINLPAKPDRILQASYWIGIGGQAIYEYDTLEQGIPPEWTREGISSPISAYALGKRIELPQSDPNYRVCVNIGTQADWVRAQRRVDCGQQIAMVAKNFDLPDTSEQPMVLWLTNQNKTISYDIGIKFIAIKIQGL